MTCINSLHRPLPYGLWGTKLLVGHGHTLTVEYLTGFLETVPSLSGNERGAGVMRFHEELAIREVLVPFSCRWFQVSRCLVGLVIHKIFSQTGFFSGSGYASTSEKARGSRNRKSCED